MARRRIVCTQQSNWGAQGHGHITMIGTGPTTANYTESFTVEEARRMLDMGHTFYVQGHVSAKVAEVAKYDCACGIETIRSQADGYWDDNLDALSRCAD